MTIALQNLLKNFRFMVTFQFYAGQFDGQNQSVTLHCQDSKKPIKFFNRIWEVVKPHKLIWISIKVKYQEKFISPEP